MADFLEDLRLVRERELTPLRLEAGLPADLDSAEPEELDMDKLWRYIEVLESTVVGKATVIGLCSTVLKPHARHDLG